MREDGSKPKPGAERLDIYTLGRFKVLKETTVISDKAKRSAKLWELFKYLLTHREKAVPVDSIVDSLWPDRDYCDQNAALHTLTHRMRKLFFEEFADGFEPFSLNVSQGCYLMKLNNNCWLDADEFTENTSRAAEQAQHDQVSAINTFQRAIKLYCGEYLPEYSTKKWVLPAKRYYRHLYLQNLLCKMKLYMDFGQYEDVCALCEKAFRVEQFMEVETLHIYFMEALLRSGNQQEALCHYDFLTTSLYQEFGTKPSAAMRDLYRKIKPDVETSGLNLNAIIEKIAERDDISGAFVCDLDFFRFLYNLELRKCDRTEKDLALILLSLKSDESRVYDKNSIDKAMYSLEKSLLSSLRKGDVITRWGSSQFLVFLSDIEFNGVNTIFKRLKTDFDKISNKNGFKLEYTRKLDLIKDRNDYKHSETSSDLKLSDQLQ